MIIYKDKEMIDLVPFELEVYKDNEKKEFPTLSEAIDLFKSSTKVIKKSAKEKQIEKQQRIIDAQEKKIKELEKKEEIDRAKGELIYQKYQEVDEILKEIKKATNKYSWKEIKDKLKGHKVIKEVNTKDKKIKVDI